MNKTLVCYFSVEKNTEKYADEIKNITKADIFEIEPKIKYTKKDINWLNPLSRCNKEKIGKKDIELNGEIKDLSKYETVYLGFPIWYYTAPTIINSFLNKYDLKDKKVILFATSGGSDIDKAKINLEKKYNLNIISSKLLNGLSKEEIINWIKSI